MSIVIIAKWAKTYKTVTGDYVQGEIGVALSMTESPSIVADSPSMEKNWALKKAKKSAGFLNALGLFLLDAFFQGKQTGVKANPADIASKMKSLISAIGISFFQRRNGFQHFKLQDISAGCHPRGVPVF